MNKKCRWGAFALATVVLVGFCVAPYRDALDPPIPSAAVMIQHTAPSRTDAVRNALDSVFQLRFDEFNTGGTAFIVGRSKTEKGYRYKALTAFHVLDNLIDKLKADDKLVLAPHIAFNSWRFGIIEEVVQIKIEGGSRSLDWAAFSFESERDIPCLTLGDEKAFNDISPVDDLFILGAEDLEGVLIYRCNLVAQTNKHPTPDAEQFHQDASPFPFHQIPLAYFRLSHRTIPGASGGPVIDINGRVIGIVTAYQNMTSLALKASLILSQIGASSDLLLVEK